LEFSTKGQAAYDKAEAMATKATELDPDSYLAFNSLGATLVYEGKHDAAMQALQKSIAIRPSYAAYSNIAVAQFQLRHYKDSAASFQQALKLDDTNYQNWGSLGDAYYYGGDTSSAMQAYRKAISLADQQLKVNPRDPSVLGDLASYYSMLGDRKNALSYLDHSLQLAHGDKELLFNAALVYNQLHETGPALEWLKKALDAGYSRAVAATAGPLDNLHDNPQYKALMQAK
jgi:serine/threonine-protein kinase